MALAVALLLIAASLSPAATNPPAHIIRVSIEDSHVIRDEQIEDDFGLQEICPEEMLIDHGVEYRYVEWLDDVADRCRVIDLVPGATYYVLYKARLASPTGPVGGEQHPIFPGNSQRATVHCALADPDGSPEPGYPFDAMIYIDNGRLFFSYSADGGPWTTDERLDHTTVQISAAGRPVARARPS